MVMRKPRESLQDKFLTSQGFVDRAPERGDLKEIEDNTTSSNSVRRNNFLARSPYCNTTISLHVHQTANLLWCSEIYRSRSLELPFLQHSLAKTYSLCSQPPFPLRGQLLQQSWLPAGHLLSKAPAPQGLLEGAEARRPVAVQCRTAHEGTTTHFLLMGNSSW